MKLELNHERNITDLDIESPVLTERRPISRFILTSGLVHVITAATLVITQHIPQKESEKELVEIQVSPSDSNSSPAPGPVAQVQAPSAPQAQVIEPASEPEKVQIAQAMKPSVAPAVVVTAPLQKAAPSAAAVAPSETLDDIPVPQPHFDKSSAPLAEKVALDSNELDADLNKVDEENQSKLNSAAAQMKDEADQTQSEIEKVTATAAEEIKKEEALAAAKMAERNEALRKEELAKAAAAQAATAAAAEAAEAAAASKASEQKIDSLGSSDKTEGPGATSPEVRALENLRQMPGNPKPQYDQAERLRGDKGQIIFQAYVTQDGRLTEFKLLQSTGFRNLDSKTLKALKQWKFYPGQEGWVELPFDWNLKGGPQEMPAYLRRKKSAQVTE